jgi:cytochrome c553
MRPRHKIGLAGLLAISVAAAFFAWLGVFNVAASTGHWSVTNRLLHFAMRASVRVYALSVTVPDLRKTGLLQASAVHFQAGCAYCHGAPGVSPSPAALSMLPPPPGLSNKISEWTDAQLFRIVRHGVRYTGMPAWPAPDRDDEVWGMVAFLRELHSLDGEHYRELVAGPATSEAGEVSGFDADLARCAQCHGADGVGRSEDVPVIAGQSGAYLLASLKAYLEGRRRSGVMQVAVSQTNEDTFEALAQYYAGRPEPAKPVGDTASIARGREIAERGLPRKGVPACLGCHGGSRKNPAYPRIAGQKKLYLETQLRLFAAGRRGGTAYSSIMAKVAATLDDTDIADVTAYFTSAR